MNIPSDVNKFVIKRWIIVSITCIIKLLYYYIMKLCVNKFCILRSRLRLNGFISAELSGALNLFHR